MYYSNCDKVYSRKKGMLLMVQKGYALMLPIPFLVEAFIQIVFA
jgi:hypothetical protein